MSFQNLQMKYTMNADQMDNPYHVPIIRGDVTRAIEGYIPQVLEETTLAMEETFKIPPGSGMWHECCKYNT